MRLRSEAAAVLAFAIPMVPWQAAFAESAATHPCASITEAAARLRCYDAAFGSPPAESSTERAGAEAPKLPPADPARDFGLTPAQRQAAASASRAADADSITVSVRSLRNRPTGEFVVTFDNGQTWVQREVNSRAVLRVGDTVTIRKAALGSYLLVTPDRIATRVRRLQ